MKKDKEITDDDVNNSEKVISSEADSELTLDTTPKPMQEKKPDNELLNWLENSDTVVKFVGSALATVAGTVSLFYVFGFIIVNLYLSSYGVREFALARTTYITSGTVFLIFHFLIFVPVPLSLLGAFVGRRSRAVVLFFMTFGLYMVFLVIIFSYLINRKILTPDQQNTVLLLEFFYAFFAGIVAAFASVSRIPQSRGPLIFLVGLSPTFILIFIVMWAQSVYPLIIPAFGGGQPVTIQFSISDVEQVDSFDEIGIEINNKVTEPVGLIDDTGQALLVLLKNGKVAKIDKSIITNVVYHPVDNSRLTISSPVIPPTLTPSP